MLCAIASSLVSFSLLEVFLVFSVDKNLFATYPVCPFAFIFTQVLSTSSNTVTSVFNVNCAKILEFESVFSLKFKVSADTYFTLGSFFFSSFFSSTFSSFLTSGCCSSFTSASFTSFLLSIGILINNNQPD